MKYGKAVNEGEVRDYGAGPTTTDGIGAVEISSAGNVVLRVGRETAPGSDSWERVAHVVLTPEEWLDFSGDVEAKLLAAQITRAGS